MRVTWREKCILFSRAYRWFTVYDDRKRWRLYVNHAHGYCSGAPQLYNRIGCANRVATAQENYE